MVVPPRATMSGNRSGHEVGKSYTTVSPGISECSTYYTIDGIYWIVGTGHSCRYFSLFRLSFATMRTNPYRIRMYTDEREQEEAAPTYRAVDAFLCKCNT